MSVSSPAERFARAQARAQHPNVDVFRGLQRFDLDDFQLAACQALDRGNSVLVAAPTGAGKTIVAEFAVFLTMRDVRAKLFYTTPIKALSNQKYQQLVAEYGASEVGLLTGDVNQNPRARIVVMTTEVLRNMIYAGSDLLEHLAYVVMDEVHYLADRMRGAVWEEVIIHLPREVRLVSLSATVSNAEEFGDWLQTVRGDTEVIVSEVRPTPLYQHVLVGSRILDLFRTKHDRVLDQVNPELVRIAHSAAGRGRGARLDRAGVVGVLEDARLLPAIVFIFSRAGCDDAVKQVTAAGLNLNTREERDQVRELVEERTRTMLDEDLAVLGFWRWRDGLERGIAAHHAGLLPAWKEVVEELFARRLLKVVFATETLALGINMPARTVVLERLEKYNGVSRVPITPGEYTQLTGRAGRRGIDAEGHAVVLWREGLQPEQVARLASRRTYPLNSSFRPTYNMAVNLLDRFGLDETRELLESSFAQFQADRSVVDLARSVQQQREALTGYGQALHCDRGDFLEYARLRRELSDIEKQKVPQNSHGAREIRRQQLEDARTRLREHPCHHCPDREQHARWAERYLRLERDTNRIVREIRRRTGAVARTFDRLSEVLLARGYLRRVTGVTGGDVGEVSGGVSGGVSVGIEVTGPGRTLQRIYGERDLLTAECIRREVWLNLDPAQLAAVASVLTYEPRREEQNPPLGHLPKGAFRVALEGMTTLWHELDELEDAHDVPRTPELATGLAPAMYRWASAVPLDRVLERTDLAPGDFVRQVRQVLDVLDQIGTAAGGRIRAAATQARGLVYRGIVAYSSEPL